MYRWRLNFKVRGVVKLRGFVKGISVVDRCCLKVSVLLLNVVKAAVSFPVTFLALLTD